MTESLPLLGQPALQTALNTHDLQQMGPARQMLRSLLVASIQSWKSANTSQLDSFQSTRGQPFKQGKLTVVHRCANCWRRNSCVGAAILTARAGLSKVSLSMLMAATMHTIIRFTEIGSISQDLFAVAEMPSKHDCSVLAVGNTCTATGKQQAGRRYDIHLSE